MYVENREGVKWVSERGRKRERDSSESGGERIERWKR